MKLAVTTRPYPSLGDIFFRWVMGMSPITVRLLGATIAASLGGIGAHWGAFASLAAIAVVAIAVIAVERRLEPRRA